LKHLSEWKRAAHVCVEYEEALWIALEDGISEVVQATCGSQCLVFAEVLHAELWKLSSTVLHEVTKDALIVVSDQDHLSNTGDFGDGLETVPDDWVSGNIEEWLYFVSKQSCKDAKILPTFGTLRDNGLNLVPLEGPPT
jgi:hypothetical protein